MAKRRVKRKLAAIMSADVVGYSRLVREDEEGTVAAVKAAISGTFAPTIKSHGGRIFKTMGDAVLAEFPSVVDALQCSVSVQRMLSDTTPAFRMGINVGDVIVEGSDIHGDGVNIAARLEGLAEPGGICISGKVHEEVKDKVNLSYRDLGAQTVKNIDEPVPAYQVLLDPDTAGAVAVETRAKRQWVMAALAILSIAVGAAAWWQPWQVSTGPASTTPDTAATSTASEATSIAVLPFTNLSDDPGQVYFTDGLAEDIITDLSKISDLFVIARNSSFQYRDQSVDVAQIGRKLRVKYILEGSVRRDQDRVRINAQLIDVSSGGQAWADRYDGSAADVFSLQDEVTKHIINALKVRLTVSEQQAVDLRGTHNPEAYDAYLRGRALISERQLIDIDTYQAAAGHFQDAIALDPDYALALAGFAWAKWLYGQASSVGGSNELGFDLAEKSIALADNALARRLLASKHFSLNVWYHSTTRKMDLAVAELERARELAPNDPDVLADLALAMSFAGRPKEAVKLALRARELNPNHPKWYFAASGIALLLIEEPDRAARHLQTWSRANQSWYLPLLFLASAEGNAGATTQAKATLARAFKLRHFEIMLPAVSRSWPMAAEQEKVFHRGLRTAGMREAPS